MIDGSVLQSVQRCFEKKSRVVVKMVVRVKFLRKNRLKNWLANTLTLFMPWTPCLRYFNKNIRTLLECLFFNYAGYFVSY